MKSDLISIGKILKPKGLKGELKILVLTEHPHKRFKEDSELLVEKLDGTEVKYVIEKTSSLGEKFVFLKLRNIDTFEQANALRGLYFKINRKDVEPLDDDSYYIFQIIGLKVYDEKGDKIGVINEVQQAGGNDVYILENESGEEILIPATKNIVQKVDLEEGYMLIKMLPGLR